MSKSDIWAENAEALAAICGWPEWERKPPWGHPLVDCCRLQRAETAFMEWAWHVEGTLKGRFMVSRRISDHVAACLWRDWVGRKLAERDVRLCYRTSNAELIEMALEKKP